MEKKMNSLPTIVEVQNENVPFQDLDDESIDHLLETWMRWYESEVFSGKPFYEIFRNYSDIKDTD